MERGRGRSRGRGRERDRERKEGVYLLAINDPIYFEYYPSFLSFLPLFVTPNLIPPSACSTSHLIHVPSFLFFFSLPSNLPPLTFPSLSPYSHSLLHSHSLNFHVPSLPPLPLRSELCRQSIIQNKKQLKVIRRLGDSSGGLKEAILAAEQSIALVDCLLAEGDTEEAYLQLVKLLTLILPLLAFLSFTFPQSHSDSHNLHLSPFLSAPLNLPKCCHPFHSFTLPPTLPLSPSLPSSLSSNHLSLPLFLLSLSPSLSLPFCPPSPSFSPPPSLLSYQPPHLIIITATRCWAMQRPGLKRKRRRLGRHGTKKQQGQGQGQL